MNLPARLPSASPLGVMPSSGVSQGSSGGASVSPKVLARGLTRHWWRILLLWLLISAPAAYFLYSLIEPTYEAYSVLRIEPSQHDLFGPLRSGLMDARGADTYLRTQVDMIRSDLVLKMAVSDATVRNRKMILKSLDPKSDLAKKLNVSILEDTFLIRVALESADPSEAAAIVNAVVSWYMVHNETYSKSAKSTLKKSLEAQLKILNDNIDKTRAELESLSQKGTVKLSKPDLNLNSGKDSEDASQSSFSKATEPVISKMIEEMNKNDLDILQVESDLKAMKDNEQVTAGTELAGRPNAVNSVLEARIIEEFKNDPEVVALADQIGSAQEILDHTMGVSRRAGDVAAVAAARKLKALNKEKDALWAAKYDDIKRRLLNPNLPSGGTHTGDTIPALELRLASLKNRKANLAKMYQELQIQEKTVNTDTFKFAYSQYELQSLMGRRDQVTKNLAQIEFETGQEAFRVNVVNQAEDPRIPSNNKRLKYMAMAPMGVLFAVLALFLLLEVKAERVADLEALSSRVRSEVYALPPLPTARSLRKLSVPEADDQVEQFIQRLDHLRFAVCGGAVELGKGRCVLITSAVGGEGKTTLAAQLAARCGNAGMSTLLIDADLRRTSLAALLDIPEGPGLSDVLKEEAEVGDVVIPVQGGTFHVLPAGLPIQDTSRVLQNQSFGVLIGQFRQVYDLIIIDSPPVLPVPDALILGRWADGAVLAARYDISRFPQVERARRQLDNAGIPVLGTVINGMRNSDTYYGRYTYNRRRVGVQPDASNTI